MDTLLSPNRDQVALEARNRIQQMVERYRLGAEIVGVTVQQIAPPDGVATAFEDAARAQEDRNRARGEAQAYADDILPQAKARADRLRQDAEGYRAETESKATGIAARFDKVVAEYAKAPGVTRDRMYFDTMQQVFSSTSKVMIDTKTGTNQVVLPLDQMLSRSVANDAAIGSRSGPVMVPPQQSGQQNAAQAPAQAQQTTPAQAQSAQPDAGAAPSAPAMAPAATTAQGDPHRRDLRSREHSREREGR
jgi:membrane protease subunit HflK